MQRNTTFGFTYNKDLFESQFREMLSYFFLFFEQTKLGYFIGYVLYEGGFVMDYVPCNGDRGARSSHHIREDFFISKELPFLLEQYSYVFYISEAYEFRHFYADNFGAVKGFVSQFYPISIMFSQSDEYQ
jgi:hypothetical protein